MKEKVAEFILAVKDMSATLLCTVDKPMQHKDIKLAKL